MIPIIHYPTSTVIAYHHSKCSQISTQRSIKMFETQKIWTNFEEISKIYRESGHCKEISDYLKKRLIKGGYEVEQKEDGTICAAKNVDKAKNNAVILQAHMDIVSISADKNPTKPIETHVKDGWLYANDRTLGADNGIGVATMLSIAEDERFKNYPLEMIITTDEETNLIGAKKLVPTDFYGKYLINLDSEEYGVITKGCAGIKDFKIKEKINIQTLERDDFVKVTIHISDAKGGHSAEVNEFTINPIKILISELKDKKVNLVSFSGGERMNAVPRETKAEVLVPKQNADKFIKAVNLDLEKIKKENIAENPKLKYSINFEDAKIGTKYVASDFQPKLLNALDSIPSGLFTQFEDSHCNKTSQNIGILKISNGEFYTEIMGRSSDIKEGQDVASKTEKILSELFEKKVKITNITPIWEPKPESFLESVTIKAFFDISGNKPKVQVEHGGLEPAVFAETKPDFEQVSIGPTIKDPHSVKERVKIDTVAPFYEWLTRVLELLQKN